MIGILSDTHDNLITLGRAAALFKSRGCALVLHAGDFVAPFAARELGAVGCPVKAVFGNCDGEIKGLKQTIRGWGEIRRAPFVFEWEGLRFLLTHLDGAVEGYAAEKAYDIIVFGHTHKPEVRSAGKALVINPGETCGWLHGKCTAALLDPVSRDVEIVTLG
jgi:putative phosphoesterase